RAGPGPRPRPPRHGAAPDGGRPPAADHEVPGESISAHARARERGEVAARVIVIRSSRLRIAALFLGSCLFVVVGFWFVLYPPLTLTVGPYVLCAIGVASILFFGLIGGILLKRLFSHGIA